MSSRRLLTAYAPAAGLCVLAAALAGSCLTWSLELPGAARSVSEGLSRSYGLTMTAADRTDVSLLPLPRIGFSDASVTIEGPQGAVLSEGGSLKLQLSLAALLTGRLEVVTATLDGARISLPSRDDPRWAASLQRLSEALADGTRPHPRRILLRNARVSGSDPRDGTPITAEDVDATLVWPLWSEALAFEAEATWHAARTRFTVSELRPAELLAGRFTPLNATAEWGSGSLSLDATARLGDGPILKGQARLEARSFPDMLALIGGEAALSPLVGPLSLEGAIEIDQGGLKASDLRVALDGATLGGAASAEMVGRRLSIQATLDAPFLDLTPLRAKLAALAAPDASAGDDWTRRPLGWRRLTGGDLDLRLSCNSAQLGPIRLDDFAASVMVRADTLDAAVQKATLKGGSLKGRLVVAMRPDAAPADAEWRATGSFDRLDLGIIQAELGERAWLSGPSQGSFALAARGSDLAGLAQRVTGRAAIAIEDGAIAGLDLAQEMQRAATAAHGEGMRRQARTPFERARLAILFQDGEGEIEEGRLAGRSLNAELRGRISLPERRLDARVALSARPTNTPAPAALPASEIEIAGPWTALAVQARSRREGAIPAGGDMLAQRSSHAAPDMAGSEGFGSSLVQRLRAYAPLR